MGLDIERLKLIRELALHATSGPWKFDHGNHNVELVEDRQITLFEPGDTASHADDCNLEYIAELSPEVVLDMINEIVALRVNSRPG
jgi:hypothetical protein